jgi:general secretion pathway protein M
VNISDRLARLDTREQRLLNGVLLVIGVLVVGVLPIALTVLVHSKSSENRALSDAADSIADSRDQIEKAKLEKAATVERYARPAPPLAAFLAGLASEIGIEIPESQDRQAVPHGKRYAERSTKMTLHKVGMLKLAKFMERIEQSGNPITISSLNIRKRGPEPDMYDVDMTVSAFDRIAAAEKPKKAAEPPASEAKP